MNSVAPLVIFDTNALWNFAAVDRLDILAERYGERATWTESVAVEAEQQVRHEPQLGNLVTCTWLGPPRALTSAACLTEVENIRRALAKPGDSPTRHLGEAECMHYIQHELGENGWFATDDLAAADMAVHRGIHVLDTPKVLTECLSNYELVCPEPYDLLCKMADANRGVWVPTSHTEICP